MVFNSGGSRVYALIVWVADNGHSHNDAANAAAIQQALEAINQAGVLLAITVVYPFY